MPSAGRREREEDQAGRRATAAPRAPVRRLAAPPPGRAAGGGAVAVAGHRVLQRGGEGVGVLEALRGVLGHRPHDHRVERGRHGGVELAGRHRVLRDVLERDGHRRVAVERHAGRSAARRGGRRSSRGPSGRRRGALGLLGREVLRRAHDGAGLRHVRGAGARDAEVGDLRAALLVHDHVVGLDVAVDDPAPVREARRLEDLDDEGDGEGRVERAVVADELLERAARQVLHRDVVGAVPLAAVEDADDVGVLQARRRSRPRGGSARRTRRRPRSADAAASAPPCARAGCRRRTRRRPCRPSRSG